MCCADAVSEGASTIRTARRAMMRDMAKLLVHGLYRVRYA
jgi:hypothetical protein